MELLMQELLSAFGALDVDADGRLSFAEASARFSDLTQAEFDALDTNNDGFLTALELSGFAPPAISCNLGKTLSERRLGELFLLGLTISTMIIWPSGRA